MIIVASSACSRDGANVNTHEAVRIESIVSPLSDQEQLLWFSFYWKLQRYAAPIVTPTDATVEAPANQDLYLQDGFSSAIEAQTEVPVQVGGNIAIFVQGYRDALRNALLSGRPMPDYEQHIVEDVIPCESSWNNIYGYDGPNGYLSIAQFDPDSWRKAGGGDPFDMYQTGGNVARWIELIADPGSSSGWPICWHRGGW